MSTVLRNASPQAGIVAALALFAAASYYVVVRQVNPVLEGLIALAVVAAAVYVWGSGQAVRQGLASRQARRGSNTVLMVVAFVAVVGLLNFLSSRHFTRLDLTETGEYTLSPQTQQVLSNLKNPVNVVGFYSGGMGFPQEAEDLLKEYTARSDKFTYQFVDLDQQPTIAQQYQKYTDGLLFLSSDRRQETLGTTESDFTNALLKVTSEGTKKVAFVGGHGERSLEGSDNAGFAQAKAALEADNYTVSTVSLLGGPVPDDVAAIVLAGPRNPLSDAERQTLRDYLKRGGKLLLLKDPQTDPQLDDVFVDYGVSLSPDMVVDVESALARDAGAPIVMQYGWSAITKDLGPTVFPGLSALTVPTTSAAGVTVTPLALTSGQSWTTKDPANPSYKEGDSRGPLTVAAAIEAEVQNPGGGQAEGETPRKARVVVVGDADFASNAFLRLVSNRDLFVNAVNWLTESEELISIRPKPPEDRSVLLTPVQTNLIWFSSIVLLPLLVLGMGVTTWWTRR